MAARAVRRRTARERSWSAQPPGEDSDVELDVDETAIKSSIISKLYAAMLIIAGIILYVYILYVMLVYLLYPCSLAPFLRRNVSTNTTTDTLHTDIDKNTLRCRLRNAILFNAALLIVFVAQHSLMACKCVKQMMNYFGVSAISRLIYVFATCSTLQFINHFWLTTPTHTLWDFDILILGYALKVVHTLCWLSIACSIFTIDYLELLGIKQLYYSHNGFSDPLDYKSAEQQYLLHHMRHPIFTAPFILIWAVPVMTYDRLLLSVMMPLYMAWASGITVLDMTYVKRQFYNKWQQLLLSHK